MSLDLARFDALIREMLEDRHSECLLEGLVASHAKSLESLESVRCAAGYYGDSKKFARLMQLVFVRTLLKHSKGKEEWAQEALEHMDQLVALRQESKGLCSPKNLVFQKDVTDEEASGC